MLRMLEDMERKRELNMREGKGPIEIIQILKPEEMSSKTKLFSRVIVPPGSSIGFHRHDGEEDIYYILSGEGTVNDDGILRKVKAGDVILTGNGAGHGIENTSSLPLELLAVVISYC